MLFSLILLSHAILAMAEIHHIWKTGILFLGLLHFPPALSSISPRISFHHGSQGRVLSVYNSDVQNTTALVLSPDGATLFVGARDAVLSLDVSQPDVILLKNKYTWAPSEKDLYRCGTSEKNCANFITVLQLVNSTHLYACGSFAFVPHDIILTVDTLSVSRKEQRARGLCPYKEFMRNTAIFVDEGLYTATEEDISGNVYVISRHLISHQHRNGRNNLHLKGMPWLNDPTFISSSYIPSEGKVLFFFREEGIEYNFMEKVTVSRVAQVCTDDNGGERILQKHWTTFAKSQLICQNKQLPFNLLQDVVMVPPGDDESPDKTLFYGIFTSQWALVSGQTAVCAFTLRDIKEVFSRDYKSYNADTRQWMDQFNTDGKLGKCGLHNDSDSTLNLVKKTFLTAKNVQSVGNRQVLTSKKQLYSRITAQRVQAANDNNYTVLYLLTDTGFLHKVVLLKNKSHIIEEIQVFNRPQIIKSILFSIIKNVVFVGFSEGVIRVPVSNCTFYSSCAECVLAQDPFCGWDSQSKVCVSVSDTKVNLHQDVENGNVEEQCGDQENGKNALIPKVVPVYLNQLVRLSCHSNSRLAQVSWRFSNHSIVPQPLYLQKEDDSLVFFVTPNTALEFHCVTKEHGYQHIVAIFSLKVQASPGFWIPPIKEMAEMLQPNTQQKSYYHEMVAVSILFAICLCVLAGVAVLLRKSMMIYQREIPSP